MNNEVLTHLVLINQMTATTGCPYEQAKELLISTDWRLEIAMNLFFDERTIPIPCCKFTELITPANTPATPPNFPETLLSFNKLSTSNNVPLPLNDNQLSSTTNPSLSSSPMTTTMMMMDGMA